MHTQPAPHAVYGAAHLYRGAFEEINALAVQRHMMTPAEFGDMWLDERIQKWTAIDDRGALVGLGIQTNDLAAWPLISIEFFERRWPKLYADQAIWYVGFVCTRQEPAAPVETFGELIRAMSAETRAAGGISVMDFCTANTNRGLVRAAKGILRRSGPVEAETIDRQIFVAYDFGNNDLGGEPTGLRAADHCA